MSKIVRFLVITFLLTIAIHASAAAENSMYEYESAMGFTVHIPASWQVYEDWEDYLTVFHDENSSLMIVDTGRGVGYDQNYMQTLAEDKQKRIRDKQPDSELISIQQTKLDELDCLKIHSFYMGRMENMYLASADGIYAILVLYDEPHNMEAIVQSFRFSTPGYPFVDDVYRSDLGFSFKTQKEWKYLRDNWPLSLIEQSNIFANAQGEYLYIYTSPKSPPINFCVFSFGLQDMSDTFPSNVAKIYMEQYRLSGFEVDESTETIFINNIPWIVQKITTKSGNTHFAYYGNFSNKLLMINVPSDKAACVTEVILPSLSE